MVRNSRHNASSKHTQEQNIQALFHEIVENAIHAFVYPTSGVPFVQIRPLSSSGVQRLKAFFMGGTKKTVLAAHELLWERTVQLS